MKVFFFAQSRQIIGCDHLQVPAKEPMTQSNLWTLLIKDFPDLAHLRKTARLARNEAYLQPDELLYPNDEIAIIPPVSGG